MFIHTLKIESNRLLGMSTVRKSVIFRSKLRIDGARSDIPIVFGIWIIPTGTLSLAVNVCQIFRSRLDRMECNRAWAVSNSLIESTCFWTVTLHIHHFDNFFSSIFCRVRPVIDDVATSGETTFIRSRPVNTLKRILIQLRCFNFDFDHDVARSFIVYENASITHDSDDFA